MRNILVGGLCAAMVVALAACEREPEREVDMSPITIRLVGDSIIQLQEKSLSEGVAVVDCAVQFSAEVEGPEGEHAVMQGGRIEYYWWQTGAPAATYDWTQDAVAQLWVDSVFPAGQDRRSREQGFGQPPPAQLVRAEVTFEYRTSNTGEVKRTEPYRFYCY
jgi:hypothetical protein